MDSKKMVKKWEYKIEKRNDFNCYYRDKNGEHSCFEAYLNRMGQEGWELVSIDSASHNLHTVLFKRPITENNNLY